MKELLLTTTLTAILPVAGALAQSSSPKDNGTGNVVPRFGTGSAQFPDTAWEGDHQDQGAAGKQHVDRQHSCSHRRLER
jgi:hypothetical protein